MKRREQYLELLNNMEILEQLTDYEKMQISDSLRYQKYKTNETVFEQGSEGDIFYIILEGSAYAIKTNQKGEQSIVYEYEEGDYFGELALLSKQKRQASIVACVYID